MIENNKGSLLRVQTASWSDPIQSNHRKEENTMKMNAMNMINENELELVVGGNKIEKTLGTVANNDVLDLVVDTVSEKVNDFFRLLGYIWTR